MGWRGDGEGVDIYLCCWERGEVDLLHDDVCFCCNNVSDRSMAYRLLIHEILNT